jgi:hypothetical protein
MPNHVHLLFKPFWPMEELIKSWKGISARRIGQGSIWQEGYRDTIIRDESPIKTSFVKSGKIPKRLGPEPIHFGKMNERSPCLERSVSTKGVP